MNTIFIVPIEPIEQRYTKQWYDNIPKLLNQKKSKYEIVTIDGEQPSVDTTKGAFLDFGVTNIYKSSQITEISYLFSKGRVKNGDKFLITDAWNYAVIAIRYMSDLLGIKVEIHSIWHAGAYDPTDILGYKMQKPWPWHFEQSVFYASDFNYYATDFHKKMFLKNLNIDPAYFKKAIRSGQPHEYIVPSLVEKSITQKKNSVIWPHRYNDDKQPDIAEDIKTHLDIDDFIITQKMNLSKEAYYDVLSETKVMFSCALHENLGISVMEGCLAGVIPVVPDRASYSEMYLDCFKYPSEWTSNFENYLKYRQNLVDFINEKVVNYDKYKDKLVEQNAILVDNFLNASIMINNIMTPVGE